MPKRRQPSPRSCSKVRSPRRHLAATKLNPATNRNGNTKAVRATQFICLRSLTMRRQINGSNDADAQNEAQKLIPIEEWKRPQPGIEPIIKRHPEHRYNRYDQQYSYPVPTAQVVVLRFPGLRVAQPDRLRRLCNKIRSLSRPASSHVRANLHRPQPRPRFAAETVSDARPSAARPNVPPGPTDGPVAADRRP